MISNLVNKTWFSRYQCCQYINYGKGSKFKLHFEALCESFGIKRKPTSVKNPTANVILEQVLQVRSTMLCTAELDMVNPVVPSDIDVFLTDAVWVICSTYHRVLKASPGAANVGGTCCSTTPSLPTGTKLETTSNTRQTLKQIMKIAHAVIGTTQLVAKYFF